MIADMEQQEQQQPIMQIHRALAALIWLPTHTPSSSQMEKRAEDRRQWIRQGAPPSIENSLQHNPVDFIDNNNNNGADRQDDFSSPLM